MDFEKLSAGGGFLRLGVSLMGGGNSIPERASLSVGNYIAINIDMTRNYSSNKNFSAEDVRNVNVASSSDFASGGFEE
jgi:hypothetical protein